MTYRENSNVFLNSSGITCFSSLFTNTNFLRNSWSYYDVYPTFPYAAVWGSLEYTSPIDASEIKGEIKQIHQIHDDSYGNTCPGAVVRNDDYIYMRDANYDDSGKFMIVEYQISTDTKNSITIMTSDDIYTDGYHNYISIIEDRKVLVFDWYVWNEVDNDLRIFIVDFDAGTCTEELRVLSNNNGYFLDDVWCSAVVKDDFGDIHLLVASTFYYYDSGVDAWVDGWRIYHKNYTLNNSWTSKDVVADVTGTSNRWGMYPYIISNNRYFVIPESYYFNSSTSPRSSTIYVYDILNDNLTHTNCLIDTGTNWLFVWHAMEDATNHKIYLEISFDEHPYTKFGLYEFDPETCTLNESPIGGIMNFENASGFPWQFASNTHLYNWDIYGDISKISDREYQGNYPRPIAAPEMYNPFIYTSEVLSNLTDCNGNIMWYITNGILKRYNISTREIDKSFNTGISVVENESEGSGLGILHLGNAFLITVSKDSGYTIDFYLMT
jgi:hypothetical protein